MKSAWALFRRDVRLAWREGGTTGTALGFYLVVVAIIPLGLGPDLNLLSRIAPGVLWVALLLASLLSADRIFHNDYEDGSLDVLAMGPLPLELVAALKSLAHWVVTGVPLALLAPLLGLLLNLPIDAFPLLVLAMLAGTPAVSFVAAIGAGLTFGLRRSGVLLALLVLPLYVPV
ncbi:MAG: heme exporter protein CcmB, partial [Hyphomicrobiales bacterium]